jgi:hypothetical protein
MSILGHRLQKARRTQSSVGPHRKRVSFYSDDAKQESTSSFEGGSKKGNTEFFEIPFGSILNDVDK